MPWMVFSIAHGFCSPKDRLLKAQHRRMDVTHEEGRWEQLGTDAEQMCGTECAAPEQTHAVPWKIVESKNRVITSGS